MNLKQLPIQPSLFYSYIRVGRLLYWSLVLFIMESIWYGIELQDAISNHNKIFAIIFWLWCFLFSFIHIFLVIMDGWSRFQNYKRAKDQLYLYGFQPKIAKIYMVSKCQRMAAETAAEELGLQAEIKDYYKKIGVKWYHYVPYFITKDQLFLFKKHFWSRTFLEKNYISKFNFRSSSVLQEIL